MHTKLTMGRLGMLNLDANMTEERDTQIVRQTSVGLSTWAGSSPSPLRAWTNKKAEKAGICSLSSGPGTPNCPYPLTSELHSLGPELRVSHL